MYGNKTNQAVLVRSTPPLCNVAIAPPPPPRMARWYLLVAITALPLLLWTFSPSFFHDPNDTIVFPRIVIEGFVASQCVPFLAWGNESSDDATRAREIARRRRPVVIRGSPTTRWTAMTRWRNTSYFSNMNQSYRVQQSRRSMFAYDRRTPLNELPSVHRSLRWSLDKTVAMSMSDFVRASQRHDRAYLYIVGSLDTNPNFHIFRDDVRPNEFLRLDTSASFPAVDALLPFLFPTYSDRPVTSANGSGSMNVFLSAQHVAIRTHYDASHNFLVQVRGTKRVLLLDPGSVPLYPESHPSHRQAQPLSFFSQTSPPVMEAVLNEGDVLYIPPYVLHHVDYASELGISVNTWSRAEERTLSDVAWDLLSAILSRHSVSTLVPILRCFVNSALAPMNNLERCDRPLEDLSIPFIRRRVLGERFGRVGPTHLNCTSPTDRPGQCDSLTPSPPSKNGNDTTSEWIDVATRAGRAVRFTSTFGGGTSVRDVVLMDIAEKAVRTRWTQEAKALGLRNPDVLGSMWVCPFFQCMANATRYSAEG